jgi:hypothetical protein
MELKKWSLIFTTALLIASCSTHETKQAGAENNIATAAIEDNEDCLDARMTLWFDSFNQFQNDGLSMEEADRKAAELADRAYNDCLTGRKKLTAETSE